MSLDKNIVIKNEFTIGKSGGGATRGATPGSYVKGYMARPLATEVMSPVSHKNIEDYQLRYMARKSATDNAITRDGLKAKFSRDQGKGGVAFSNTNISLTHKELTETSKRIQEAFDGGHTVQKFILSFTEEYLRENDIIDENFVLAGPGSYRGNIDQLKLRKAITEGINRMTRREGYIKPVFVGVIQVDTKHVHAHIALTDEEFSEQRIVTGPDERQEERGKISKQARNTIRRGIDMSLKEQKPQKSFRNQVDLERRNVVSFVKKFSQHKLASSSKLQLLYASLPPDQRLWRYSSNAKVMRRSNEIAKDVVTSIFKKEPELSGYNRFSRAIDEYVSNKAEAEGLSDRDKQTLKRKSYDLLYERVINAMYSIIKDYDKRKDIMTPMINLSIKDIEELYGRSKDNTDSISFEIRLRGYKDRFNYHNEQVSRFRELYVDYRKSPKSEAAEVMGDFLEHELSYHRKLSRKYSHFLRYRNTFTDYEKERAEELYEKYEEQKARRDLYDQLLNNPPDVFLQMSPLEQDEEIKKHYDIDKGSWFFNEDLRGKMFDEFHYEDMVLDDVKEDYIDYVFAYGIDTENPYDEDPGAPVFESDENEIFSEVKALDLHTLTFDFPSGADISQNNIDKFTDEMTLRRELYNKAFNYISRTNQDVELFKDVDMDILEMESFYESTLKPYQKIPPLDLTPEPEMERSEAPRLEELPSDLDVVVEATSEVDSDVQTWE